MTLRQRGLVFAFVVFGAFFFSVQFAHAGAADYQSPGTYSFTVPAYSSLTVQVWGAGGGGGTNNGVGYNASDGGYSTFSSVVSYGGGGGGGSYGGTNGSGGGGGYGSSASGGGGGEGSGACDWATYVPIQGGTGGTSPSGGGGGSGGGLRGQGAAGGWPGGGGGGGGGTCDGSYVGSGGGGGGAGYSSYTYSAGQLGIGGSVTVVVGGGGASAPYGDAPGGQGGNGRVYISWTDLPAATCTVSVSPNPKDYAASATLSWTTMNANTSVYITNVGYVGTSGSTSVAPTQTTAYNCTATGTGGTGTHAVTLTVNPPASCTAPWGSSVSHGSSVTAYETSSVPYGSTCNSETRTCTNGILSGSYQYQTCTIDDPPPTCTPSTSYTCSGTSIIQTDIAANCTETQTTLASCILPEFCSPGSATCLYNAITGTITASPRLVASGKTTTIAWSTTDAESCTATGTNGDSWTGTSNSKTSSPITQLVQYTLQCDDADPDTTEDDYTTRVTVVRVPGWLEL